MVKSEVLLWVTVSVVACLSLVLPSPAMFTVFIGVIMKRKKSLMCANSVVDENAV